MVPISSTLNLNIHLLVPSFPKTVNIMGDSKVTDKYGIVINRGDYVWTRIRGGTHEGHVSKPQLTDNPLLTYTSFVGKVR